MKQVSGTKLLPSTRWTSFEGWDYNGMKERLESALAGLNKDVLLSHAELIKGQKLSMSENFSAGQFWICFEMVAEDGSLVIARVRLPRHPNTLPTVTKEDELYTVSCEISTMQFLAQKNLPSARVPKVYAYEGPGSQRATAAGAMYMLIEGFCGNTLQDIAFNLCDLPAETQDHIITQWTMAQAQLATLKYPQIGSIAALDESGEPIFGKLSTAAAEGLVPQGPFSAAADYFIAIGEAALRRAEANESNSDSAHFSRLGALVFLDIVEKTDLFQTSQDLFPLNHMDLGMQNIIVDDDSNFLGLIDWEFAQAAPLQVNHYPMPFPLLWSDRNIRNALDDPTHLAHENISKQHSTRQLYCQKFRDAETLVSGEGAQRCPFAEVLESRASKIYACFTRVGNVPENDPDHVREMVQLAFGVDGTDEYLARMQDKLELASSRIHGP